MLPEFPGTINMPSFDKLWMCLYARLGELCVDPRPAVRKSAGQTLFSTISAHGNLLKQGTWQAVLWQVLFPLLEKVETLSNSASSEKVDTGGNILIHHTRNTAQKQWAETQVLTLSGVAKVFNTKRQLLQALGDFLRAWKILLEYIENSALSRNNEVSFAALKSFQEILHVNKSQGSDNKNAVSDDIWSTAWKVWLNIGTEIDIPPSDKEITEDFFFPNQGYLTALVQIFPNIFQYIKSNFTLEDLKQLCKVLTNVVHVPVSADNTQYLLANSTEFSLTALHDGILHAMDLVQKEAMARNDSKMIPEILKQYLVYSKFMSNPPVYKIESKQLKISLEWVTMNYIPFGEKALTTAVKLYEKTADNPDIISNNILHDIIAVLYVPLSMKYNCASSSTWKLATNSLITVLKVGLPVARNNANQFDSMWKQLAETLNVFLFPKT